MDARQQRNAFIEARLRGATPIAQQLNSWELYLSNDNIYIIRYHATAVVYFLAISAMTGEIKDMSTQQSTDMGDLSIVLSVFTAAGLSNMRERAHAWYQQRPR